MIQKTLRRKLKWSNTNTKQIPKNRRKQHEHKTNTKKQKKTTRTQNKYQKIEKTTKTKRSGPRCSRRISSSCFLSNNCRCYSMFGQSLSLVVCRRAHVLFTLFTCLFTQSGVQHICCCVFVLFSLVYVASFSGMFFFDCFSYIL